MKVDLWPLVWIALFVSIASCTAISTVSYNNCVADGGRVCRNF